MVSERARNMYLNTHYDGMDPKKLILMLYDGALKHIRLVKEGILENDIRKRGESLGKVIAIVSELNSSLDPNVKDESIDFLRGLYESILKELPRVSITNDLKTVDLTNRYISKLRDIWATQVMGIERKAEITPVPFQQGSAQTQSSEKIIATQKVTNEPHGPVKQGYGNSVRYTPGDMNIMKKSISA